MVGVHGWRGLQSHQWNWRISAKAEDISRGKCCWIKSETSSTSYLAKIEESEDELTDKIEDVVIVNPVDDEDDDDGDATARQIHFETNKNRPMENSRLKQQLMQSVEEKRQTENKNTTDQKESSLACFAYKNWLADIINVYKF